MPEVSRTGIAGRLRVSPSDGSDSAIAQRRDDPVVKQAPTSGDHVTAADVDRVGVVVGLRLKVVRDRSPSRWNFIMVRKSAGTVVMAVRVVTIMVVAGSRELCVEVRTQIASWVPKVGVCVAEHYG